jgi:hypothetical protein
MEGFFMSKKPNNKTQKLNPSAIVPISAEPEQQIEPTVHEETAHEAFMKAIAGNPRFVEAKPSGKAFVIVGARPSAKK